MPFFHPSFIDWSLASPPSLKQNSRLACQLISTLAPDLASVPFDTGQSPQHLARKGPIEPIRRGLKVGRKLSRRLRHRVIGTRRHNLGTQSATEILANCGLELVLNWDATAVDWYVRALDSRSDRHRTDSRRSCNSRFSLCPRLLDHFY